MPSFEARAIARAKRESKKPRRPKPRPEDLDPTYKARCALLWRLVDLAGVPPSRTSGNRAQVIQQHESLIERGEQLVRDLEQFLINEQKLKGETE